MADRIVQDGISIRELRGRSGSDVVGQGDTGERAWLCKGSIDPLVCRAALFNQTFYDIDFYDGLNLSELSYAPFQGGGPEDWEFTASYSIAPLTADYTVTIDTGGGLLRRTLAYQQNAYPAPGHAAPNFSTAIDVQDREINGVDTVIPALKLDIVAKLDRNLITDPIGYAKTVASLTGAVNSGPYLGFDAGELLFMGGTGAVISDRDPTLTFTFSASQNVPNLTVGPISGIVKPGHDYIWYWYKDDTDPGSTNFHVKIPAAAYVSKVYLGVDFAALGIGEVATTSQVVAHRDWVSQHQRSVVTRLQDLRKNEAEALSILANRPNTAT